MLRWDAEVMHGRQDWDWRSAILAERVREHPVDQVISVLRDFGALGPHLALTGLGQAARAALAQRVPPPITLGLPAAEFLNILAGLPDEEAIPNWPGAGETTPRCPGNRSVG
ncbi:hypothetical protein [Actinomadura sp. 9N407]|uniref:hypothetical protein n=1 Tax=Actinomadura sp. 9N407 TaxID=3375154 RepID=UPI003788F407